jgi:EmrB/QacA subfamily drug resistance transporter
LLLSTFVGTLGNSVSNVALPAIMAEFGVPLNSAVWVVTLYVLTFAALMPVCGYLGDLHGQRRLYLLGMALFSLGSLASGLAPSLPALLGARVLMGIGIAPTLPAVMAILTRTFAAEERGRAMGLWALVNGTAHALGPPLSGFLTQHTGWRAVFLVGLPLSLLSLLLVWRRVPRDDGRSGAGLDFWGAVALTATALGLMLALSQGARWGWTSPRSLWVWGLTLAALVTLLLVERRTPSPLIDPELLADPRYRAAIAVISAQYFCLFGLLLALPIFLIQVQGWSEQVAGLLVPPLPLTMALVAPPGGRLGDLRGSRWTCSLGMGLVSLAGLALLAVLLAAAEGLPWWAMAGSLVLMGAGMGLTQSPVTAAVTHVAPRAQIGAATGIFHMGRFFSGSLGTTTFGLILQLAPGGMAQGFQRSLGIVAICAALAVLAARWLLGRRT